MRRESCRWRFSAARSSSCRCALLLVDCVPELMGVWRDATILVYLLSNALKGSWPMSSTALDMSLHERRRAQRMEDPEFRGSYERATREIEQTDQVIRALDELRLDLGMSKAELARRINRNASSIRRLFTASSARPELPLIAAIADALGAEVRVVPKRPASKRPTRQRRAPAAA
jgi:hypothetical protein